MEQLVFALSGLWVWLTRRRRIADYLAAAKTLEFAYGHLLQEFTSRASTSDRGSLLAHQSEALSLLKLHAAQTHDAVAHLSSLRGCCRFVARELMEQQAVWEHNQLQAARPEPVVVHARPVRFPAKPASTVRIRFRLPGPGDFRALAQRFLGTEVSGAVWTDRSVETAETEVPLKAA